MKKYIMIIVAMAMTVSGMAQETYEIAGIETQDLNGTARYVGMGGAMEALGADISTISTNPAGIGMFRRGQASVSMGLVMTGGEETYNVKPTRFSFDQGGFVVSTNTSGRKTSFLNFAFNYSKSRNFSQILKAANYLKDAAQNKQTAYKVDNGITESTDDPNYSQVDYMYVNKDYSGLLDAYENGLYFNGTEYEMDRGTKGFVANYDFNISGNIENRVFLGLTFGVKDVRYESGSLYYENLIERLDDGGLSEFQTCFDDWRRITGTGVDVKFGAIFRPIADSPFRIGLNVSTPTFYKLTSTNRSTLAAVGAHFLDGVGGSGYLDMEETYRYQMNTPWNFGASLGHTVGQNVAIGVSWNYSDYGATSPRVDDGDYYYWGDSYSSSHQDNAMKYNVKQCLKGVHTIKAGVEFKPVPEMAVRLGYNYVSPMYKENGYRDPAVRSYGNYYSSQTDFTNWKATNRITAGLGYAGKNFFADLAYQYSTQKGDFYPFTNVADFNTPTITEVKNDRHQLLMTLGYKF